MTKFTITIRDKDIKIRKSSLCSLRSHFSLEAKQALPSKPFKNKKLYSRLKIHIVASLEARQTSGISKLS